MDRTTITPIRISPDAHLISSFWKHPAAPVGVQMNTMVLTSREPVVFDTGVAEDQTGWLEAVSTVVEPADVRWIVLSHDDHDHVGNLAAALERFPNATAVASWFIHERLAGSIAVDPRRQRWVAHGEQLDIGDRVLAFERPPLFDSPTTRGIIDSRTGLYWGGDLGAALSPAPVAFAEDVPADEHADAFLSAHQWNSPWFEMLDDARFQAAVTRLAGHEITTWANTHGPVYRGPMVERAVDLLRQVPHAATTAQPGQIDLDAIVSTLLTSA